MEIYCNRTRGYVCIVWYGTTPDGRNLRLVDEGNRIGNLGENAFPAVAGIFSETDAFMGITKVNADQFRNWFGK